VDASSEGEDEAQGGENAGGEGRRVTKRRVIAPFDLFHGSRYTCERRQKWLLIAEGKRRGDIWPSEQATRLGTEATHAVTLFKTNSDGIRASELKISLRVDACQLGSRIGPFSHDSALDWFT
jgi:hypothetical protein